MGIKAGEDTFYQAQRGIVQDGLVLNLDAGVDESYSGGTVWRDLKGGNNGTLTNMNELNFDSANGGSLTFDGGDEYAGLGTNLQSQIISTQSYSIVVWIYPTSDPSDSGLVSNYYGNTTLTNRNGFSIRRYGGGKIRNIIADSGPNYFIAVDSPSNSCPINTWSHVVCTWSGGSTASSLDVYINGQSSIGYSYTNANFNNLKSSGLEATVGRVQFGASAPSFAGNIPIVRIYNRALTSDEVARNYNATRHRFGV